MGIEVNWHSHKGRRTEDNRDYCGVGLRSDAAICIVLDGSTSGPKGGELAQKIAHELIDWFVAANREVMAQAIIEIMQNIHNSLSRQFPFDSACYVIALFQDEKPLLVLHAGDCLLGQLDGKNNQVCWRTKPHTLANATTDMSVVSLVDCPARHRLTRSFRPKEFMMPDVSEIKILYGDSFIVATDGFWAELNSEEQSKFMEAHEIPVTGEGDDRSALHIRILGDQVGSQILAGDNVLDNFYMKTS